jgi:hypothetical protein
MFLLDASITLLPPVEKNDGWKMSAGANRAGTCLIRRGQPALWVRTGVA